MEAEESIFGHSLEETKSRYFEGVSNEATAAFALLVVFILTVAYLLYINGCRAMQAIHPSQLSLVQEVRNLLGHVIPTSENGNENESTSADTDATAAPPPRPRLYNHDRTCPICFGAAQFASQTNCGHLFCCSCITGYWRHTGSLLQPVKCPVCRTEVSMLLPMFAESDPDEPGRQEASNDVNDYNRRFSGASRPIWEHIQDLPVLIPYMLRRLFSLEGLMWVFRLRVLLCMVGLVVYVLSPLDVIPEAIFGLFGILDDIFVAFVLLLYASVAFRQVMANRNM
uniref:E3 ubiquitin-protein ligase RNF170 n=1 Tax=Plectus sambesii TaxID=2011161 RepID=A0A914UJ22_9BILA